MSNNIFILVMSFMPHFPKHIPRVFIVLGHYFTLIFFLKLDIIPLSIPIY